MTLRELQNKWQKNLEFYREQEIGSGVHSFVKDFFLSQELLNLLETARKTDKFGTFVHDAEKKKEGRPDFVLYMSEDVTIPVEVKCYGRITEGIHQLRRYQLDYSKQFGILTDGFEWRFYRAATYTKYTLDNIFENPADFLQFWNDYIKSEQYYLEIFNPSERQNLFPEKMDLNEEESRKIFFEDTTKLIRKFRIKLKNLGILNLLTEKQEVETTYSYLIQFILYKVLVDAGYKKFIAEYQKLIRIIKKSIIDSDFYNVIVKDIRDISEYVSQNIYKPFSEEQSPINQQLAKILKQDLTIDDIAPWLDVMIFIDKYNFSNLKNEIFGFIYENYLKDLYHNENKGQYFTDPAVVNFMLDFADFTTENIKKNPDKISLIDPSCGAGTFLYSAVDRIIDAFFEDKIPKNDFQKQELKENAKKVEKIINNNIFGLDIEEFPLYLAEMNILMRLLPLIVNDNFENPIDEKLKIFKTKDSISEFLDAGIGAINPEIDYLTLFSKNDLGYQSFMRDNKNLQEMIESMQGHNGERLRFDFVFGNPPYISYNDCSRQQIPFINKIKDKSYNSITFANVYGVNMHSVPNNPKKYAPKPNLWAFFVALSLALLKKGGKLCYIIPQTLLTETDYDVLRYHLAKFTTIEKIIPFASKMFIDRGLKGNKTITTSSMILVVKKTEPVPNSKTQIVKYKKYSKLPDSDKFKKYLSTKSNRRRKNILQKELLDSFDNWNFISLENDIINFIKSYKQKSNDLSAYYNHNLAKQQFNNVFYFDAGFMLEKNKYSVEKNGDAYKLVYIDNEKYLLKSYNYYPKTANIIIPQGSQGLKCLDKKYKIIWRKTFTGKTKFNYCELSDIILDTGLQFISSDNKQEILFLFALLNAKTNTFILNKLLKLEHEQKGIFIVIKRLKKFIRIPKITPDNQHIKGKIIELTEKMLALENVVLKDLVDFSDLSVQRFDNVCVKENFLVLNFNDRQYRQKITSGKIDLVKQLISEKSCNNVTLSELKNLEAIDFEEQKNLKNHIDNLVFALYFDVKIENENLENILKIKELCKKNDFYKDILNLNN
ncbi:MAG: type I restriction endonuclease [Paludibacter sp.]|nr:type I restriction endonuclease [Paludibacter sp.]